MKKCLMILSFTFFTTLVLGADLNLRTKAEKGDAKSQYDLYGQILWSKSGNIEEAEEWCKKSADNGYWEAQLQIGNDLIDKKEFVEGKKYLEKAAGQGSADAIDNLGYTERGSTGAPQNFDNALMWYRIYEILIGENSPGADYVKRKMDLKNIENAEREAHKWIKAHPKWKRKYKK